jgi:tripartite motif-containing protein 2/3
MQATDSFRSVVTGQSYNIRDKVTCLSTNVIYLIDCAHCHGTQYVGETGLTVRKRFYGHTYAIRKGLDTLVAKHFRSPGHSLTDMRCTVIEQVKAAGAAVRKQREKFWRHKLHTNYPEGLNVFD